jgi:hypothetical protein
MHAIAFLANECRGEKSLENISNEVPALLE